MVKNLTSNKMNSSEIITRQNQASKVNKALVKTVLEQYQLRLFLLEKRVQTSQQNKPKLI